MCNYLMCWYVIMYRQPPFFLAATSFLKLTYKKVIEHEVGPPTFFKGGGGACKKWSEMKEINNDLKLYVHV